jgi:hypothetical protein
MLACLLLLAASALGVMIAVSVVGGAAALRGGAGGSPRSSGAWTRLGLGLALGQVVLLWLPFLCARVFDLGARAAGLCALLAAALACGAAAVGSARGGRFSPRAALASLAREALDARNRASVATGIAFSVLFAWLLYTHDLLPRSDGLHSAGVTWGDLPMHLSLATRFLYWPSAPPLEHPLYLHGPLAYPFLADYGVAVLTALGLPLRWAFIASGLLPLLGLLLLLHALASEWWRDSRVPARAAPLALTLFLLAGGFGFVSFALQVARGASPLELLARVNFTYLADDSILKAGHVGNLFIAARTASHGMLIGLAVLLLLARAVDGGGDRATWAVAGACAGALPLVHSHSFIVVCGVALSYALLWRRSGSHWLAFALPLLALSLPQLVWLHGQSSGPGVRVALGFLRPASSLAQWLADIVVGMGPSLLLLPFAWRSAAHRTRRLAAPLLALLPIANLITFTPAVYDNIKLVAWFDVAAAILIAGFIAQHMRGVLGWLAVLASTSSGALAVGFELRHDVLFCTNDDLRFAELVIARTPADAIIATAAAHHDAVAMFSGRRVLVASPYMLATHGIDVRPRARDLLALYAGGRQAEAVIEQLGVTAVVVGPNERADLPRVDEAWISARARARYDLGERRLYLLRGN